MHGRRKQRKRGDGLQYCSFVPRHATPRNGGSTRANGTARTVTLAPVHAPSCHLTEEGGPVIGNRAQTRRATKLTLDPPNAKELERA